MQPCIHNAHLFLHQRSWGGLPKDAMAHVLANAVHENKLPDKIWIVLPDELLSVQFVDQLQFWLADSSIVNHFPADEIDCFQGLSPARHIPQQRLIALQHFYSAEKSIVVSSVFGTMHNTFSQSVLKQLSLKLHVHEEYHPQELMQHLVQSGYIINQPLEESGQCRLQGDTLHIWPIGNPVPIRLSFFDTELEAIHSFTKNERLTHQQITILPAREAVINKEALIRLSKSTITYIRSKGHGRERRRHLLSSFENGLWQPGAEDYLPALFELQPRACNYLLIEPSDCFRSLQHWTKTTTERWKFRNQELLPLIDETLRFCHEKKMLALWDKAIEFSSDAQGELLFTIEPCGALQTPQHLIEPLLRQIQRWLHQSYSIIFVSESNNRAKRLELLLEEHQLETVRIASPEKAIPGQVSTCTGYVQEGFIDNDVRVAVLSIEYILQIPKPVQHRVPKALRDAVISSLAELKPGDYVVHRDHGIGQFIGITLQKRQGIFYDCIQINYANNAAFFLPVHRIENLYRYRSMGGSKPRLDRIGSSSWGNRLQKAKEKALQLADKLIAQFAIRALQKGHQYSNYPTLLNDFSLSFPYQETPDQQTAIDDVLSDLANELPSNRLIVGDVGFGKTEVAMRAAVRVVAEGHQVAILCPTTILALQHHRNFLERCTPFGINVAVLSRLQTNSQRKKIFSLVQKGEIDILIGTHAIFGKDLRFQKLGLVIADEEHRFGVRQKEKLLALSQINPDSPTEYIAMSATPIPRTLHMALSGLRNVSVIATPPPGRRAIKTLCLRFNIEYIRKHIWFELQRGGQVFFIHNNIDALEKYAKLIRELFPNVIVRTASGRSNRSELEKTMLDFMENRIHILVCTTIVENGVDLPNVNTIIINNAHHMGLSQLYQLRGRVGRGKEQGHCLLMIPADELNKEALSRINALKQFTALGSGFAIANADLEIRGSGDLLGKDQSGHINSIGLDTYIDILNEAILELKPHTNHRFVPEINIPIESVIPTSFIPDIESRLKSYRKLATACAFTDIQRLLDDWEQQFGEIPGQAMQTARLAEIRVWARLLGIERIDWLKTRVRIIAHPSSTIPWQNLKELSKQDPKRFELQSFKDDIWQLFARFSPEESKQPLHFFQWLFPILEGCIER